MQGLDCRDQGLAQVVSMHVTWGVAGLVWGLALARGTCVVGGVGALGWAAALHGCGVGRRDERFLSCAKAARTNP